MSAAAAPHADHHQADYEQTSAPAPSPRRAPVVHRTGTMQPEHTRPIAEAALRLGLTHHATVPAAEAHRAIYDLQVRGVYHVAVTVTDALGRPAAVEVFAAAPLARAYRCVALTRGRLAERLGVWLCCRHPSEVRMSAGLTDAVGEAQRAGVA